MEELIILRQQIENALKVPELSNDKIDTYILVLQTINNRIKTIAK